MYGCSLFPDPSMYMLSTRMQGRGKAERKCVGNNHAFALALKFHNESATSFKVADTGGGQQIMQRYDN